MNNVLVLGCGRSGTSMVAGSLANIGYWTGFYKWSTGQRFNPKGYFEDPELIKLNERLLYPVMESPLDILGNKPQSVIGAPNRKLWLGVLDPSTLVPEQPELMSKMKRYLRNSPFCLKDPLFSYTLEAWKQLLGDTRYICVFRHPLVTATSIVQMCNMIEHCKHMRFSIQNAIEVWVAIYRKILEKHSLSGDWFFIHYDQMFTDERVQELEDFIDAKIDRTFADIRMRRTVAEVELPKNVMKLYNDLCNQAHFNSSLNLTNSL